MNRDEAICYVITWDGMHYHARCRCCQKMCEGIDDGPSSALCKALRGCKQSRREELTAYTNHWKIIDLKE